MSPLRPGACRAQPGGQSSGRHCAGRPVYRGRHPERGRRGHPLPGRGEQRPLPGDHQGVYAPDAGGRAGEGLHPPPEAGQRSAVQDHPDGFCRPLPLHPAHHPGQRPGGRAGRLRREQHGLRRHGEPRRLSAPEVAGGARHRDAPAGLCHAGTGVQRGGGHASGGPRTPGHLPGQHPHHGQWPRPAHRLRDSGAAHGGQRPPRAAVRGLFRPGAVFHRRVRGPLHRRIQPRGGVLPDGLRTEPRPGGTAPRLRLQPQGPHGDAVGAGLRLRNAVSGPPAQAGGAHPDGAAAFPRPLGAGVCGGIVPQHGSAGPARPRAAGAESAREG